MSYRILGSCLCLASALCLNNASADSHDFRLSGFLSQSFIHTTDNNFFGDSNHGSWDFRELGLNASWQPHPTLLIAGQAISRKAGNLVESQPTTDYALIDFSPISGSWGSAGVSLGRIKNPLGLYNDTRDVAFTRPGVFAPQTIYLEKFRDLFLSIDGGQIHADWTDGDHGVQFQLNIGEPRVDDSFISQIESSGTFPPGDLGAAKNIYMGRLLYDWQGKLILGLSAGHAPFEFNSPMLAFAGVDKVDITAKYWALSAQYQTEDWRFTGEYIREQVNIKGLEHLYPLSQINPYGYYLQADYRLKPDLETFVRYESGADNRNGQLRDEHRSYTRGWSVGARWDFHRQWALRGEFSRYNGHFILPEIDNPETDRDDGRWDMFSLQLSFRF